MAAPSASRIIGAGAIGNVLEWFKGTFKAQLA